MRFSTLSALSIASAAVLAWPLNDVHVSRSRRWYENGKIVDGTGARWFYGDLAIRGDGLS